jgi:predicted nuclease of predicted toxin-antitoxin system
MKLLFDESLSPKLVELLSDLSQSLKARFETDSFVPDLGILEYAVGGNFILVSTDSDFEDLLNRVPGVNVVILRSCNYPTETAAEVLRRNAIRIRQMPESKNRLIILDR